MHFLKNALTFSLEEQTLLENILILIYPISLSRYQLNKNLKSIYQNRSNSWAWLSTLFESLLFVLSVVDTIFYIITFDSASEITPVPVPRSQQTKVMWGDSHVIADDGRDAGENK